MEILLNIDKYCIETSIRKTHEKLVIRYFDKLISDHEKLFLEHQIEGLKYFLEHADFGWLRTAYPDLNGQKNRNGSGRQVRLNIPEILSQMKLVYGEQTIEPEWRTDR